MSVSTGSSALPEPMCSLMAWIFPVMPTSKDGMRGVSAEASGAVGELATEATADERTKLVDHGVSHCVEDLQALASAGNEAGSGKSLQMPGNVGLGATGSVHDLADRALTRHKRLKDAQAGGFTEHGETAGDQLQRILVHWHRFLLRHSRIQARS